MAPYLNCLAVSAVMPSYSRWNGRKLHGDRFLMTEILKDKFGFKVESQSLFFSLDQKLTKIS